MGELPDAIYMTWNIFEKLAISFTSTVCTVKPQEKLLFFLGQTTPNLYLAIHATWLLGNASSLCAGLNCFCLERMPPEV